MKYILISAIWCPSCIIMRPRYQKYLSAKNISFQELDFDDDEDEIKKYNIGKTLPVMIVIKNNDEVLRIIGEKSEKELVKLFDGLGL